MSLSVQAVLKFRLRSNFYRYTCIQFCFRI